MFELSFGVACGAKQFLYFRPNMSFLCFFSFGVARRDNNKLKHFGSKTMQIVTNDKKMYKEGEDVTNGTKMLSIAVDNRTRMDSKLWLLLTAWATVQRHHSLF